MLFSGKKNVFMCLVAFQKIFSDVWLCSWKYHRKHILYLLLTFSHIFSVAKRIYNIIHSSKHKKKTQKKKNHQIRTLREIAIGAKARSRSAQSVLRAKRRSRSKLRAIGAVLVMSADNIGKLGFGRSLLSLLSFSLSLFLSLSLSLSPIFQGRKLFEVKMETEMISRCFGSHFRSTENAFQFDRIWSNNQTPHFSKNHFQNQFEVNSNAG